MGHSSQPVRLVTDDEIRASYQRQRALSARDARAELVAMTSGKGLAAIFTAEERAVQEIQRIAAFHKSMLRAPELSARQRITGEIVADELHRLLSRPVRWGLSENQQWLVTLLRENDMHRVHVIEAVFASGPVQRFWADHDAKHNGDVLSEIEQKLLRQRVREQLIHGPGECPGPAR